MTNFKKSFKFKQKGSSNGHSPVLNLSKSGGLDQGSTGDQSDRSENQSPAPSIRDEDENLSEDNISDVDDREAKDEGRFTSSVSLKYTKHFLSLQKKRRF